MSNASLSAIGVPLTSVIVRSMGRPELDIALNSIAQQTYPNIEVILVDVKGQNHPLLSEGHLRLPLHFFSVDKALGRSEAANLGMSHARGEFLIFLDDDDYFAPHHIAKLIETLMQNPDTHAAYAGVAVVDATGTRVIGTINEPFHRLQLLQKNYIPIHAVLFKRWLIEKGCRFDEQMMVYEDWDFWIQLSMHTQFIHLTTIGAYYRSLATSSGAGAGVNADEALKAAGGQKILDKWQHVQASLTENVRTLLKQGLQLQRNQDAAGARSVYEKILCIQPDNVNALNLLGMIAYEDGRYEAARSLIEKAVGINNQASGFLLNLGLVLQALNRKQEAIDCYRRVLVLDPNHVPARHKLLELSSP